MNTKNVCKWTFLSVLNYAHIQTLTQLHIYYLNGKKVKWLTKWLDELEIKARSIPSFLNQAIQNFEHKISVSENRIQIQHSKVVKAILYYHAHQYNLLYFTQLNIKHDINIFRFHKWCYTKIMFTENNTSFLLIDPRICLRAKWISKEN